MEIQVTSSSSSSSSSSSPQYYNFIRRVKNLMSSGRVAIGGSTDEKDNYIEPTVLVDCKPGDPVLTDEVRQLNSVNCWENSVLVGILALIFINGFDIVCYDYISV